MIEERIDDPFITVASDIDIVEEYDPVRNIWGPARDRRGHCWALSGHSMSGKITSGGAPEVSVATGEHDVYDLEWDRAGAANVARSRIVRGAEREPMLPAQLRFWS